MPDAKLLKEVGEFISAPTAKTEHISIDNNNEPETIKVTSTPTPSPKEDSPSSSNLRISLERLESMTNEVEELLVIRERLRLRQQQLSQVTRKIRSISRQLEPIQEQVQNFYNQLAIAPTSLTPDNQEDFDSLELDQYTEIHSSLQTFQELMLQFQENYADFNFINQDISENLDGFESHVYSLYDNVTQSRLVPFKIIAQRFFTQVQSVANLSNKSVNLLVQGEDVLIDQIFIRTITNSLIPSHQ